MADLSFMQAWNWQNDKTPLAEPVWVEFADTGQRHKTLSKQHLAQWIERGGTIVDGPGISPEAVTHDQ